MKIAIFILFISATAHAQITGVVAGVAENAVVSNDGGGENPEGGVLDAPEHFHYTDINETDVTLNWDAVSGATGYEIFKDGVFFASVTGTEYDATGITEDANHLFTIATLDGDGKRGEFNGYNLDVRTGSYPEEKVLTDDTYPYTSQPTYPPLNTPYTNEFGLTERRITNRADYGDSEIMEGDYAKLRRFNHDNTWFKTKVGLDGGTYARDYFNTSTFDKISRKYYQRFISSVDNKSYWADGNELKMRDESGNDVLIKKFTQFDDTSIMPTAESNFSWDMRYVALEAKKSGVQWGLIYDIENDVITTEVLTGDLKQGFFAISRDGNYACALSVDSNDRSTSFFRVWRNDGNDTLLHNNIQDNNPYSSNPDIIATGHGDFQVSIQGNQVFVSRTGGRLLMYNLETGTINSLMEDTNGGQVYIGHVSGQNRSQKGWIFVDDRNSASSKSGYASNRQERKMYRKVYAVCLDENSSGIDETLTRTYSYIYVDGPHGTHAVSNDSGEIVTFNKTSNSSYTYQEMYAVYKD